MSRAIGIAAMLAASLCIAAPASAQRGTGAPEGVGRQASPSIVELAGTVTNIEAGPCAQTTGRSLEGIHLDLRTRDHGQVNLHLGPESELRGTVARISVGATIQVEAFRTVRLPQGCYVARTIAIDGERIILRDRNLRPRWRGAPRDGSP